MTVHATIRNLQFVIRTRLPLPPAVDLRTVSALLARLSPRERRFLVAAGAVFGSFLLYLVLIDPLWDVYTRMHSRIVAKEHELEEVIRLGQEYRTLRAEIERAQAVSETNVSPVAFLEELASKTVGQEKVSAINPAGRETREGVSVETLELRLNGVSLRELVELLYKIDTTGLTLRPTRLSIKKRYKDPYAFDVLLTAQAVSVPREK
jgi:type II secretory pathway component PulM